MKKYFPKSNDEDLSIVRDAYVFGGQVSTEYLGLTEADAVALAGKEVIFAYYVDEDSALEVAKKLKDIGFSSEKKPGENFFIYDGGNKIYFHPSHLLSSLESSSEWKLKVSYKALNKLSMMADLYYSFETGEIIVDGISDASIVSGIFFMYNNNKNHYVVSDKKFNLTYIGPVEVLPRTTEKT